MDATKDKLIRLLQELLNPGAEIGDDDTLEDLGADSLDIVEVGLAIEDDFDFKMTDDDMAKHVETTTVAQIAAWLEEKGVK